MERGGKQRIGPCSGKCKRERERKKNPKHDRDAVFRIITEERKRERERGSKRDTDRREGGDNVFACTGSETADDIFVIIFDSPCKTWVIIM